MSKNLFPLYCGTFLLRRCSRSAAVLAGLFLAGCATVIPDGMENHIIAADYRGNPTFFDTVDPAGEVVHQKKSFNFDKYLEDMSESIRRSRRKKIMIYCFGGMNTLGETIEASARNARIIMKDSPDVYPIFINWDSELFGCYLEDLLVVRQGIANYWMGPMTAPLLFVTHLLEALCKLPAGMLYQTIGREDTKKQVQYEEISKELQKRSTDIAWHLGKDLSEHKWRKLSRFGYVVGFPARVGTTALIDTFGSRGWREMRRRARLCFNKEPDQSSPYGNFVSMFATEPDGVFSRFARMLIAYTKNHPDTEITLIGHCMGTIIATEFLSRFQELPIRNIVFMAAASSVQETTAVVRPYLLSHPKAHFYNLCLHPWIDWFDMMDYCVLPCGSVLEWVNIHLTEPLSKEDYTIGIWDVAMASLPRQMTGVEKQVTIKGFGIQDPGTNINPGDFPHQHTDFSNPASGFWKPEFWQIPPQETEEDSDEPEIP